MPSTIGSLLTAAGLTRGGAVGWGESVQEPSSGVYVVSLSGDQESVDGTLASCPVSDEALESWLEVRPELWLDGRRPTAEELARRLRELWLPDEVVLYVGKATSLAERVGQYYSTPLGARRPHAGGYLLKTLTNLGDLHVHWAVSDKPLDSEHRMLERFCAEVSDGTRQALRDPAHPLPFANLEWPQGVRKQHGISGAREPRRAGPRPTPEEVHEAEAAPPPRSGPSYRTQRVTANDLAVGQIRIPVSSPTKALLPNAKCRIQVVLRGSPAEVGWDPRLGPDRERSGVLWFGKAAATLRQLVVEDAVLRVSLDEDGTPRIE